jgi:hypothetical protein
MSSEQPPDGNASSAPAEDPDDTDDPYAIESGFILCSMETRESRSGDNISYKVTFPPDLEHARVVRKDDTVTWFADTDQGQVLFSDTKDPWRDKERFDKVDTSKVSNQRVTTIPRKLFEGYTSPYSAEKAKKADQVDEVFHLRNRHLYYAVSSRACLSEDSAYFVPVEDVVEIHGKELAKKFSEYDDIDPFLEDAEEEQAPEEEPGPDEDHGGEPV